MRFLVLTLATVLWLILATAGCQSTSPPVVETPTRPEPTEPDAPPAGASAESGAREALRDAEALLRDGDLVGATALFSVLSSGALPPAERPRYALLGGQLAVRAGDAEQARRLLAAVDVRRAADPVDGALVESWLLAASGQPARAATRLMQASVPDASLARVNDAIWDLVSLTPAFEVLSLAERGSEVERGWWTLRRDLLHCPTLAEESAQIAAWRAEHSTHPAARQLPHALDVGLPRAEGPRQVALLLPVSGTLGRAGRAVRDGFLTAWFAQPADRRFAVRVYDTAEASVTELYQQAVADGAELIVGPLRREAVAELNELAPELPVLALNYLPSGDPAPQLAQLGLAIEDDVSSLVAWLRDAGLDRIMVVRGPHEWAIRVERALEDQGIAPVASHLLPEMRTVTETVGTALHIEDSRARHAELQRIMNLSLAFAPRSRTDIDAIVALVNAVEVTALVPALRFHYADRIPAFAIAQTLQGANNTTLRAMDGYGVVELPWQLPGDPGKQMIQSAFSLDGNPFASMYALGADAFRLTDRIVPGNRDTFVVILGNTGVLSLSSDGRVRRELARMRVSGGRLAFAEAL